MQEILEAMVSGLACPSWPFEDQFWPARSILKKFPNTKEFMHLCVWAYLEQERRVEKGWRRRLFPSPNFKPWMMIQVRWRTMSLNQRQLLARSSSGGQTTRTLLEISLCILLKEIGPNVKVVEVIAFCKKRKHPKFEDIYEVFENLNLGALITISNFMVNSINKA